MIHIGAGSMGGALLNAWLKAGIVDAAGSAVVDPNPSQAIADLCSEHGLPLNPEGDGAYDLCVLATKPQVFGSVLPSLAWPDFDKTLFISIAAGIGAEEIAMLLTRDERRPRVVRVMPSLPAFVGRSMSLLASDARLSADDRTAAERLMAGAGAVAWTDDEDQLDRWMGVAACGPAFLLRVVEGLAAAAEAQGASPYVARKLAEETFAGTAALLEADDRDAGALRQAVTSPGGTTAAGLDVLNARGVVETFGDAVEAAYRRARELSGRA